MIRIFALLRPALLAAILSGALTAGAARAEILKESERGFVTRHELIVEADPKEVWLALISPARWWSSQHTWSADAANLTLTPQAGGCFCETIPEVNEPGRFTLQGSVEHMRVIQAYPEQALRMVGALGPLQSEPVTGVLTIALTPLEGEGGDVRTRIVWEYNVGGSMRFEIPVISEAVDGVIGLQARALGEHLGAYEVVGGEGAPQEPAPDAARDGSDAPGDEAASGAVIDPDSMLEIGDEEVSAGAPGDGAPPRIAPSVEEAFSDFGDSPEAPGRPDR